MDAPRTRYKVVERGRRLEVVDTWNNDAPVKPIRDAPTQVPRRDGPAAAQAMRAPRLDQRGHRTLGTRPWYDAKGPRQLVVTEAGEAKLKGVRIAGLVALFVGAIFAFLFWPLFFVLPFVLMNKETRKSLRAASTKFLDSLNQPGTGSSTG